MSGTNSVEEVDAGEIPGGAVAYLGIGASGNLGISFDIRTLQFRGSVGATLGLGFGGGLGIGAGAVATQPGSNHQVTGTLAVGPGAVTVSEGGLAGGRAFKLGPQVGAWAAYLVSIPLRPRPISQVGAVASWSRRKAAWQGDSFGLCGK